MNEVMSDKPGSELALDSAGFTEDVNCVPEGNKRVSSRNRKPNSKYSEDIFVDYNAAKTIKDFDGSTEEASNVAEEIKRVSSQKRKTKPKYSEDDDKAHIEELSKKDVFVGYDVSKTIEGLEGSTEEASNVAEEMKVVSSRKRKPKPKYSEDDGKAHMEELLKEDVVHTHVLEDSEGKKQVSSRKRKPNSKYSEDIFVEYNVSKTIKYFDGSTEEASNDAGEMKRVSSRKRKPKPKYSEDDGKAHIEELPKEDVVHTHVLEDSESKKQVSSRKRKPNSKYSEDIFVDYNVSNTIKDFDGSTEGVSNVAEEMKRVSSRKRKPKPKDNEDDDKAHIEELLKEDVIHTHILEDSEGEKRVSSRKRKQNTCFGEDSGPFPSGKKGISLRERNPNTDYNENEEENVSDYSSDTMGEDGLDEYSPVVEDNPRKVMGKIRKVVGKVKTKKGPLERNCEKSQIRKLTRKEYPPLNGMLSQLYVAAGDPMKGHSLLSSLISFFMDYRNSVSQGLGRSFVPQISEVEGVEDSYLTERTTGSNFEPGIIVRETNGASYNDEKAGEDYTPTAVILFFADEDSVPSKSDLHHIFDCYGPLNKVNTEVVKRLRRARVVFKRRSDADMAFKSTGSFSIFGPSLVSYRLSYFY